MRIKRLEIQGFKSFKDKTVIHFDHTITGIVGPNGCGKSNIVDAFFWVMGEQSYKHMRGNGSDDLIFNGSSRYSPLGMAEATLVMETDAPDTANAPSGASSQDLPLHLKAKEIAVTRRLYRGGEGEYFINGVHARLKDIQELFMDTGVGTKGYSVIEQGQIGKIVNAKPEDRRLLIEEAAGIAKYKARKKESLRKMEAAQANLSRLTDIIQEIERSLGSLERQAQKARQYKKYKEELVDKELTWGRRKIHVLRHKLDELHSRKSAMEQELAGLRAELHTTENSIESDRILNLTDTKAAEEMQAHVQRLSDELTREKSALDLSRRRQGDLHSRFETLNKEKSELAIQIATESEKIGNLEQEAQEAAERHHEAAQKAQTMDEQVRQMRQETEAARRAHEETRRKLLQDVSQASQLSSKAASLASRAESTRAQAERLVLQVQEQREKLESLHEEGQRNKESFEEARQQREAIRGELQSESMRSKELEQKLRQRERERDESRQKLTLVQSKLESLEELSRAREGFGDASKTALEWAGEHGGEKKMIALADLLDVTPGYEAAMEGWLESQVEHLISADAALALDAIHAVRDQKSGRVAIHVEGAGNSASADAKAASAGATEATELLKKCGFEVLGQLTDFVSVSSSSQMGEVGMDFARRLISRVLLVQSFDSMSAFVSQGQAARLEGWSVLAMDGSVLDLKTDASGIFRGGTISSDGTASLLRRKRAIAELQEQVAEFKDRAEKAENEVQEARQAMELAKAKVLSLQSDAQALEIQAATLERDVHQINRATADAENQLRRIEQELEQAREAAESATAERAEIEVELEEIVRSRADLEAMISEGEVRLAASEAETRSQESEYQALRVKEASLRERASSLRRELETSRSLISDRERRLVEIDRTLEVAGRERDEFSGGDNRLEEKIAELTLTLATAREQLSIAKDRIEQSSARVNVALERIKELHRAGDQKNGETSQVALDAEKVSSEIIHLIQNLEEKYGPACLDRPVTPVQEEMTEPVVTAEMTAEEEQLLSQEVERLRERIRRLGDVNPEAVEQFEEQRKRFDYLAAEKADLERSIGNLEEAIEHINKTSEERFKKAFETIADRFERLFPIIFGGGQARLSLVYPEGSSDILDAGIDILAQPPGKKIANITLLSGGEKALTAVSLIFAIFMVKPSPFCILDEVDAPLDDANIGKFNALLREMSAKSQFILITHNKKTMELNDTLYGVTMEEPGVSKMVSVEMR